MKVDGSCRYLKGLSMSKLTERRAMRDSCHPVERSLPVLTLYYWIY